MSLIVQVIKGKLSTVLFQSAGAGKAIISHFATDTTEKQGFRDNNKSMEETNKSESKVIVEVTDHGPLRISGNFILKDLQRDYESAPGEVWLCRCGKSSDKPFCDKSHKK